MLGMIRMRGFPGPSSRLFRPPVAGITRHVHLAIRELGIDIPRHRDHHSRDLFVALVVGGEVARHVAEVATHTQRYPERLHGFHQVLGRQQFQILGRVRRGRRTPGRWTRRRLLPKGGQREKQDQHQRFHRAYYHIAVASTSAGSGLPRLP